MNKTANTQERWDNHWSRFTLSTRANPGHVLRRRLIDDVSGEAGAAASMAMAAFRGVMGLSLFDSPWGWQIVARAFPVHIGSPKKP